MMGIIMHICPQCHKGEEEWSENNGHGVRTTKGVFCCRGCALGSGCTCS